MKVIINMEIETPDYGGKEFKAEVEKLLKDIDPISTRLTKFKMRDKYGGWDDERDGDGFPYRLDRGGFMNIDEVLLTMGENEKYFNYGARFPKERDKAQCLKLLEWLKEECKGHDFKYNYQEGTYTEVPLGSLIFNGEDNAPAQINRHMKYTLRQDCSWCMTELEAMLREV